MVPSCRTEAIRQLHSAVQWDGELSYVTFLQNVNILMAMDMDARVLRSLNQSSIVMIKDGRLRWILVPGTSAQGALAFRIRMAVYNRSSDHSVPAEITVEHLKPYADEIQKLGMWVPAEYVANPNREVKDDEEKTADQQKDNASLGDKKGDPTPGVIKDEASLEELLLEADRLEAELKKKEARDRLDAFGRS